MEEKDLEIVRGIIATYNFAMPKGCDLEVKIGFVRREIEALENVLARYKEMEEKLHELLGGTNEY